MIKGLRLLALLLAPAVLQAQQAHPSIFIPTQEAAAIRAAAFAPDAGMSFA